MKDLTSAADTAMQTQAALAEPLCDAAFRARLLRQGLSNDEIAQYVAAVETERAATKAALDALVAELDRRQAKLAAERTLHQQTTTELERVTRERDEIVARWGWLVTKGERGLEAELVAAAGREQRLRDALPVFLAELKAHIDVLPAEDDEPIPDAYGNVLSSLGYLAELNFGHGDREDNPVLFDALASLRAVLEEGQQP